MKSTIFTITMIAAILAIIYLNATLDISGPSVALAADSVYESAVVRNGGWLLDDANECKKRIGAEMWTDPVGMANKIAPFLTSQGITPSSTANAIDAAIGAWVTNELKARAILGSCP